jgi:hypothetical protein
MTPRSGLRPGLLAGLLAGLSAALLSGAAACSPQTPEEMMLPDPMQLPDTLTLRIGPFEMQPGEESTRCVTAALPTTVPIDVVQISTQQALSHHVIFYRESPDRATTDLVRCPPLNLLGGGSRAPLFIGESNRPEESQLTLPTGVSYRLEAKQIYTIEGHFLNAATTARQAYADVILKLAPEGAAVQQADMIFISALSALNKSYDSIKPGLPPMTSTRLDPVFQPMTASIQDAQVFALTTHQHRFGTRAEIFKSRDVSETGESLYVNTDWEHPVLKHFSPALSFAPGEGFRFYCEYNNTLTKYVKFGDSAVDEEMCIIWAHLKLPDGSSAGMGRPCTARAPAAEVGWERRAAVSQRTPGSHSRLRSEPPFTGALRHTA